MSGRHSAQHAYGQRVVDLGAGYYRISWVVDRYYAGSRLRYPTGCSRDTDEAGARRFAARWGIAMPQPRSTP